MLSFLKGSPFTCCGEIKKHPTEYIFLRRNGIGTILLLIICHLLQVFPQWREAGNLWGTSRSRLVVFPSHFLVVLWWWLTLAKDNWIKFETWNHQRALDPRWDTTHLVTGAADNTVRLWDIQTGMICLCWFWWGRHWWSVMILLALRLWPILIVNYNE